LTVRILIADDEPQIHSAYRDCFAVRLAQDDALADLGAALFATDEAPSEKPDFSNFHFEHVTQGEEAVDRVAAAIAEGQPYAVLFLDMRMPPGIDGYETAKRVRQLDANINIVVVSGYSDHNPMRIAQVAGPLDRLYYVTKPFRSADLRQLAQSLASKWTLDRALRDAQTEINAKVAQLEETNVELMASEARNRHLALHDPLTRLPNRLCFSHFLDELSKGGATMVAVLYLDLDHFKNVNDTLGHSAGDELICQLGERIRALVPEGSLLARLGGDEFGLALLDHDEVAAIAIARDIVELCKVEFEILGTRVNVGGSVGVAVGNPSEIRLVEIQRRPDLALYAAKRAGRSTARLFSLDLDDSAKFRSTIERGLRDALRDGTLTLAYQPIVTSRDGQAYAYEALLRWVDPVLGNVPPAVFVPIAEQCGLAKLLGEWVIHSALGECASWEKGMVSINVSTLHFHSSDLLDFVVAEAAAVGLPHDRIILEITETAMFANPKLAAQLLINLRATGVRVALDDFGTGYSSLSNLRDFEIDCIKIDKSFVDALGHDSQASAIVTSVAALARLLGLKVVAEGVESIEQAQSLNIMGCGLMQGFYYSKALRPDQLPYHAEPQHGAVSAGAAEQAA